MTPPVPVGALIFGDDFVGAAGSKPDTKKWAAKARPGQALADWNGFNEISLDGVGNVVISAVRQSNGRWKSGWLSTSTLHGWSGPRYVEARVKVAAGYGVWNGPVWEWAYPYGAGGIEIDVCEQLGKQPKAYHTTVHNWQVSPQKQQGRQDNVAPALSGGFHVYAAVVEPTHVDFYFDGALEYTVQGSAIGVQDLTKPEVSLNCSLNMGGWGGTPNFPGPAKLTVDYMYVHALS